MNLSDIQRDVNILADLLHAFQPSELPESNFLHMQPGLLPGSTEYLHCGAYTFLENVLNIGLSFLL